MHLNDSSGIRKSFDDAKIQGEMASKLLETIASAVARDAVAIIPTAWYAAKAVRQKEKYSLKDLAHTPPSPTW